MNVPVLLALLGVLGGHTLGACPKSQWLRLICTAGFRMLRIEPRFFWDTWIKF